MDHQLGHDGRESMVSESALSSYLIMLGINHMDKVPTATY